MEIGNWKFDDKGLLFISSLLKAILLLIFSYIYILLECYRKEDITFQLQNKDYNHQKKSVMQPVSAGSSFHAFQRRLISRLLSYREVGDKLTPEYQAEWGPTKITLEELCTDFQGQPLLSQVRVLSFCQAIEAIDNSTKPCYIVQWKTTWVSPSELSTCAFLLHDFWVCANRR